MELLQLYYFQVTARFQHISKAAACLHITQPALSQTIKRLEKELETELFDRVGKEIVLNEKGEILLKYANSVLSSVESAKAELLQKKSELEDQRAEAIALVKEIDDKSFMIILESNEVLGEGFHVTRVAQVEEANNR